jgi:hypothetical protein
MLNRAKNQHRVTMVRIRCDFMGMMRSRRSKNEAFRNRVPVAPLPPDSFGGTMLGSAVIAKLRKRHRQWRPPDQELVLR